MRYLIGVYIPATLFIVVSVLLYFWQAPIDFLKVFIEGKNVASYFVFVLLLFSATVFMPVTIMPIIPIAAPVLGPFVTGVLSVIGWTSGAVVAFLIARYLGRPILARLVSIEKIEKISEKIPEGTLFFFVVLIRLTFPVDIMSYAIGLTTNMHIVPYTLATMIGVTFFSFAFAYSGDAFFGGNFHALEVIAAFSLIVFFGGWYILLREQRKRSK